MVAEQAGEKLSLRSDYDAIDICGGSPGSERMIVKNSGQALVHELGACFNEPPALPANPSR